MRKTWKKPLHKRKIWTEISWTGRFVYYMQPLVEHLFDIWLQQLPFPTILKGLYTCGLLFFLLLPILYPLTVLGFYYAIFQYVGERHWDAVFPQKWDLIGAASVLWNFEITNKSYLLFLNMYLDRCRVIITAISSTVDYFRMAYCLLTN
ncbi:uncharacterized protein LOC132790385 [Drosophila nasuta]|uniref:Uncharacterized protein LOC117571196 n=1 Tax=Drosophila albomicans TaxID=7291 RepID=A0A6P8X8D9_DROAB|nr:uncharacterized protein LOC117571196 [Drosophila albomicans]XP_060654866.1 uncharacterized protein LOC132790385 [Drosophila nasuta]